MADDAGAFLLCSRQVTGDIDESDNRDAERVAKSNESRCFVGAIHIQAASQEQRLICDKSNRMAMESPKTGDQIAGPLRLQFEELVIIRKAADDTTHVIRLLRVFRNEILHVLDHSIRIVSGCDSRRVLECA